MYLQSLEIFGFKSFAHKTILHFPRGVTAVVGPNGCGKSNVLDALRWVLGEQSAKALRGGEMADVIFSGTDSKQPVNMAEVSLTFAECEEELGLDYHEVRITRRIFRDGKSEYLLNKTPCRLRDIHQLFMDTGIGRSAYSIMEQGKIDAILSSRPEDRRAIFEEAAGITKYKAQKKEALRKLEFTEANLLRLTDIIKEVKRQIGSLQRQAGKARRYQTLLTDVKILDTHYSKKQFDEIHNQLDLETAQINRLTDLHTEHEAMVEVAENRLESGRFELEEIELQLQQARHRSQEIRNEIQTAKHRVGFHEERITEARELALRYRNDVAAAEEKLRVQETQIADTDQQLELILSTLSHREEELRHQNARTMEAKQERGNCERELQQTGTEIYSNESQLSSLRGELAGLNSQREASETRAGVLRSEISQYEATLQRLEEQSTHLKAAHEESASALESRRISVAEAEGDLHQARREAEQAAREIVILEKQLSEKESRVEVLRQLNDTGEGLNEGTQAVLRGLDRPELLKPAILGALASLIEVPEDRIGAVEAALGHHLHTVIVRDETAAEAIFEALIAGKTGRAAIAPTAFLPRQVDTQLETLPDGALAWAIDCAKGSPSIRPLLDSLLANTLVVPDLSTALRLRPSTPGTVFATLAGETISREGIVSAGKGNDQAGSILQRKIQIQTLDQEAASLQVQLSEKREWSNEVQFRVESHTQLLSASKEALQSTQLELSTLQGQSSLIDRELRESTGKLNSLRWEMENVNKRAEEGAGKLQEISSRTGGLEESLRMLMEKRATLQNRLESLRETEASLSESLNELRISVATEQQRRENLSRQRQPMAARLQELQEVITSRLSDITGYDDRASHLTRENEGLALKIATFEEEANAAEARILAVSSQKETASEAVTELDQQLRSLRRQLAENQDQRGKHEVKQTQLQLRRDHIVEHAMRRFQVDLSTFTPDSYGLHTTLRSLRKANQRGRFGSDSPESGAEPVVPSETATIGSENAESGETPIVEASIEEVTEAITSEAPGIDWEEVAGFLSELNERLDSIGPVNLDAIQEYDELEERHRFLEEQNNDLTSSKAELLDVIAKINTTTRVLFADTFEKIRVNFQEMFTELFGGGKANLLLTDEADPLESGIEIIAKPPGKQLQSITLLSGGEKTMTAVAMLFAIYMVKPSPFCVLDEMDAPLDESNISRFIKILDRFVGQSQFVVITHNKRTIARAEVLYGVTMEEHGISKLVTVRLAKKEENSQGTSTSSTQQLPGEGQEETISIAESFGKSGELHSTQVAVGEVM